MHVTRQLQDVLANHRANKILLPIICQEAAAESVKAAQYTLHRHTDTHTRTHVHTHSRTHGHSDAHAQIFVLRCVKGYFPLVLLGEAILVTGILHVYVMMLPSSGHI